MQFMNKREDLFANKKISVFDPCLLAIIASSIIAKPSNRMC